MPFGLTPGIALALACALLGAAYVRGYAGFGFAAIFLACAALVTNPVPLIPVVFICEILMTVVQIRDIHAQILWRQVLAMLAGAALILPVAVGVILSLGDDSARLAVSLIVGAASLLLLSGWTIRRAIGLPGFAGVGVVSGLCNAAGVGGLPVAAFLAAQPIAAPAFRATMIVYVTGIEILTLPLLAWGGMISGQTAIGVAFALPILVLGLTAGSRRFAATSPATFRRMAVLLLLALSAAGILRALLPGAGS